MCTAICGGREESSRRSSQKLVESYDRCAHFTNEPLNSKANGELRGGGLNIPQKYPTP